MELSNNILAVVEPAIRPTEIKMDALAEEKKDEAEYKQSTMVATLKQFILINGYQFAPTDVIRFELNLMGDLPECEIELSDEAGKFAVGSYPRDGDFFNTYKF